LDTLADLLNFTSSHKLPEAYDEMVAGKLYTVDLSRVYGTYACTGLTLVCKKNAGWIGQLVDMPGKWQLHGDGKHKLHHGKWILVTFGTHCNAWDIRYKRYRHSFRLIARI
jgi:hypothetical protein